MRKFLLAVAFCLYTIAAHAGEIGKVESAFVDASRDRSVPYLIYHPEPLQGAYPVVIISHGLGGSVYDNEHLGKYLAANGFIAVHVQHPGSDRDIYRGARNRTAADSMTRAAIADPQNAVNRFLDIPFVVAQLAAMNESDERFKGHLNMLALGMAGHSYGAGSTMVAAGARIGNEQKSYRVPSLRAGVLLSPSPPDLRHDVEETYQDVKIPLFHITGTRDETRGDRLKAYKTLTIPDQYMLVLSEADHTTLSGERIGQKREKQLDKQHIAAILGGSLMFFRAYLKDDAKAKAWLRSEYPKSLSKDDQFEFK